MSDRVDSVDRFDELCAGIKAFRENKSKNTRIPDEFRKAIVNAVRGGRSILEVSRLCGLSETVVQRWSSERRKFEEHVESPKAQILNVVQKSGDSPHVRISCDAGYFLIELKISSTQASV